MGGAGALGGAGASMAGASASSSGSTSSGGNSCEGSAALTAANFADREAALFCDTLRPCCAAAQLNFDQTACEKYVSSDFQGELARAGSGAAFDCAAGQRCLDEIAFATQGCNAFDKAQLPDCNHLLVGTLPVGAACTVWKECLAPIDVYGTCELDPSGTGTCALAPSSAHGKVGDACGASCDPYGQCTSGGEPSADVACYQSDGLYCAAGQCAPMVAVGASCWSQSGCAAGTLCLNGLGDGQSGQADMPGHCVVPAANGRLATPSLCVGKPDPEQD